MYKLDVRPATGFADTPAQGRQAATLTRNAVIATTVAAIVAVALASSALRLARPSGISLRDDEIFSWGLASQPLGPLLTFCQQNATPPCYYLALKAWSSLAGTSPLALRSLSATAGLLTAVAAYLLCREIAGHRAGLIAACLIGLHGNLIVASRRATPYSLVTLLLLLSWWALLVATRGASKWAVWALAATTLALCSAFTNQIAWPSLAAQLVFTASVAVERFGSSTIFREGGAASLSAAAAASVTASIAVGALASSGPSGPTDLIRFLYLRATGLPELDVLACLVWLTMVAIALRVARWRARGLPYLLTVALVGWLSARRHSEGLAMIDIIQTHVPFDAFFVVCYSAYIGRPGRPVMGAFLSALIAIPCLLGALRAWDRVPPGESAWLQAASHLNAESRTCDVVLLDNPSSFGRLRYYESRVGPIAAQMITAGPGRPGDPNRLLFEPPMLGAADRLGEGALWSLSEFGDLTPGIGRRQGRPGRRRVLLGVSEKLVLTRK